MPVSLYKFTCGADELDVDIDEEGAMEIARRSRGTPRLDTWVSKEGMQMMPAGRRR